MEEKSFLMQRKTKSGIFQHLYPVTTADNIIISVDTDPTLSPSETQTEEQLDEIVNQMRGILYKIEAGVAPYNSKFVYGVKGESETTFQHGNAVITKKSIGLDKVENTADAEKNVLTATKLSNGRYFQVTGAATSNKITFNGSGNVLLNVSKLDASALTGMVPVASIPELKTKIRQVNTENEIQAGETCFLVNSVETIN